MKAQLVGTELTPNDLGFDFASWRPYQLEAAERILNSDKKVITLSAPTGFGKSVVVQIPSRLTLQRQLILTRTKTLQNQYERDGIVSLYGRDNYACNRHMKVTALSGVCRAGMPCSFYLNGCNYFDQKRTALSAQEAVLNYAYFFSEANGPGQFTGYDYIVCDEGHSVPEELSRTFSVRIYFPHCRAYGIKVPKDKSISSLIHWARANISRFRKAAWRPREYGETDYVIRGMEFERKLEVLALINKEDEWVVELGDQAAVVKPIWPNALAVMNLWPHATKFIFCSATINPNYVLPMLGFDPNQAENIEIPSQFPKEHRPIFIRPAVSMNHRADEATLRKWVDTLDEILSYYPDHKGLIHTANYQLAKIYLLNSRHLQRIIGHTPETRQITLERFKNMTENKVLVSPALTEGIDLPYDLCRFQVIAKVPFPNLTDKVWEARFRTDKTRAGKIYIQGTIDQIVQAAGRGVRASDDYCETWIIDANVNRLLQYNTMDFPKFFREAIIAA